MESTLRLPPAPSLPCSEPSRVSSKLRLVARSSSSKNGPQEQNLVRSASSAPVSASSASRTRFNETVLSYPVPEEDEDDELNAKIRALLGSLKASQEDDISLRQDGRASVRMQDTSRRINLSDSRVRPTILGGNGQRVMTSRSTGATPTQSVGVWSRLPPGLSEFVDEPQSTTTDPSASSTEAAPPEELLNSPSAPPSTSPSSTPSTTRRVRRVVKWESTWRRHGEGVSSSAEEVQTINQSSAGGVAAATASHSSGVGAMPEGDVGRAEGVIPAGKEAREVNGGQSVMAKEDAQDERGLGLRDGESSKRQTVGVKKMEALEGVEEEEVVLVNASVVETVKLGPNTLLKLGLEEEVEEEVVLSEGEEETKQEQQNDFSDQRGAAPGLEAVAGTEAGPSKLDDEATVVALPKGGKEAPSMSADPRDSQSPPQTLAVVPRAAFSLVGSPGQPYQRLLVNLDLDIFRAKTLARKGRSEEAEELMRKAIRDWPDDGRPYVVLGRLLSKRREHAEARKVFEEGCQAVGGDNPYIWQAWATMEVRLRNFSRARKLFDAATASSSSHAAAWHGWACLELREGNTKKARELLKRGLRLCGPNEYMYQTLAVMETRAGRPDDARSLFDRATKCNPGSAASWLAWALLEAEQGEQEEARKLFQRSLEASPRNRHTWQAWALFEAEAGGGGNSERARLLFQRGAQLNPRDPAMLQAYALFEYGCGFPGLARDIFRQAAQTDPSHQPVWMAWGWMEWKEGNVERARQLYQRAADADSSSKNAARVFQAWGVLEEREGNLGLARALFKRALRCDPSSSVAWLSWAAMEEREGNGVRADELRSLCMQQRTEVVDSTSSSSNWDLSEMLSPAIDRMKSLFSLGPSQRLPTSSSPSSSTFTTTSSQADAQQQQAGTSAASDSARAHAENEQEAQQRRASFDVDRFLEKRLPREFAKIRSEKVEGTGSGGSEQSSSVWRRPPQSQGSKHHPTHKASKAEAGGTAGPFSRQGAAAT